MEEHPAGKNKIAFGGNRLIRIPEQAYENRFPAERGLVTLATGPVNSIEMKINYEELIRALSDSLDLVRMPRVQKGKRMGDMARIGLKTQDIPKFTQTVSNLIFLAGQIDAQILSRPDTDLSAARTEINAWIYRLSGSLLHGEMTDLFFPGSEKEDVRKTPRPEVFLNFLDDRKRHGEYIDITLSDLKRLARLFAEIVDAKSPFTAEHSAGVGRVAGHIARLQGLSEEVSQKVEVAGLLHDLGKLRVPVEVLDKPDALESIEMDQIRHHSYQTYAILSRIEGLEDIAQWAANHHETLNGKGYPFRRGKEDLSIESRIIAVADVFQALAQKRPYRKPFSPDQILRHLKDQAEKENLDSELVRLVETHFEMIYRIARVRSIS
jgi:HD-GYP domain-containing protein (c-di-GMP phosphodiesterase class II)